MRNKAIVSLILSLVVSLAYSQNVIDHLYGVYQDQSSNYWFMSPDINSASITNIGPSLPIVTHYTTASAINRNREYYYIAGADGTGDDRLICIRMADGSIVFNRALDGTLSETRMELQYNNGNNKLYGINLQSGNDVANVLEVDTSTGAFTLVKSISAVDSKVNGSSTIDEVNNRYFFNASDEFADYKMYVVDLTNGTILAQPGYSGSLLSPPLEMEYDPIEDKLYGLNRDDNGMYHFAKIGINTALVTNVASIGGMSGIFSGSSTFDPIGRRYFVNGFDINGKKRLYIIDITDGSVIVKPEYTADPFGFSMDLEYMFIGVIGIEENETLPLQVYPNPTTDVIWFNIHFTNALQVEMFDMLGKTVLNQTLTRGGVNQIDVTGLEKGIYNIRATDKDKVYSGLVVVK